MARLLTKATGRPRGLAAGLAGLAALVLIGGGGCGDDGQAGSKVPDRPADITGVVTGFQAFEPVTEDCIPAEDLDPDGSVSSDDPPVCTPADNDVVGWLSVEEQPDRNEGRKISFTIAEATTVVDASGTARAVDDLPVGQAVEAWADGPCRESYPEQCDAEAVRST